MFKKPIELTIGLALSLLTSGCTPPTALYGSYFASSMPMARSVRSTFQPYKNEAGAAYFKATFTSFYSEKPERNNPYFQQWLKEWMAEYQYCQNGHEIISNVVENIPPYPDLQMRLTVHGRCK